MGYDLKMRGAFTVLLMILFFAGCGEDSGRDDAGSVDTGNVDTGNAGAGNEKAGGVETGGVETGSNGATKMGAGEAGNPQGTAGRAGPSFTDVTASSGIEFQHRTGFDGNYWFPEITGPGCAIFDADGDGDEDIFFVDGGALAPDTSDPRPRHRLYANDGNGRYTDVTSASGISGNAYGQGCAVADFDADGDLDLYLTNVGANELWVNDGTGRFTNEAGRLGLEGESWSTSAAWADVDADGDLDLYVANYCLWSPAAQVPCKTPSGEPDYCNPKAFEAAPDVFYRSEFAQGGNGFVDATTSSGIGASYGRGLGVVVADLDGDQRLDIYVANDGDPNSLWINEGETFREDGLLSGAALNAAGDPEASMGVTLTDLEPDGDWDLFMTHMTGETNTLYINDGHGLFEDLTDRSLGSPSKPLTGFGTYFFDPDLDGDDDLFVANGAVIKSSDASRNPWPYQQRDQFFVGEGGARFYELSVAVAPWLKEEAVSRGAAFGDLDADGDIDIVVGNADGPPRVLRNDVLGPGSTLPTRWFAVRLRGERFNLEGIGAEIRVAVAEGAFRSGRVSRDGSYASSNQPRALFAGLPGTETRFRVSVRWSDGRSEVFVVDGLKQDHLLVYGKGASGDLDSVSWSDVSAAAGASGASGGLGDSGDSGVSEGSPGGDDLPGVARTTQAPPLPELSTVDSSVADRVRGAHEAVVANPESALYWKDYGLALYADISDPGSARTALEQAVLRSPTDLRSIYLLAVIEEEEGRSSRSAGYLRRTIELDPDYAPARIRLAENLRESEDFENAETLLDVVLSKSPEDPDALESKGRILRARGQVAEAIAVLKRAVTADASSRGAHYELGLALRESGDRDGARAALEASTQASRKNLRDPWMNELREGRGGDNQLLSAANQARLAGNLAAAEELYREYTQRQPDDAVGWSNLAAAVRDQGRTTEALAFVDRALALEADSSRLRALKASVLLSLRRAPEAEALLREAVELDPTLAQAWSDLAGVQSALQKKSEAVQSLERYVALRPSDAAGRFRLGEACLAAGDPARARELFLEVVAQDDTQVSAHYRLGGLALQGQDGPAAETHFRNATRLRPEWAEAHLGLAHALRVQEDFAGAREAASEADRLKPGFPPIQRFLEGLPSK